MNLEAFLSALKNNKTEYKTFEPMKNHTTFKIGGSADVFVCPRSAEELVFVLESANENSVPFFVLGNGSNILVSDDGIAGAVISTKYLTGIDICGEDIVCGAGETLFSLCLAAKREGLSGLEFAYGIPGSVGGAFFMNAGAYGGEIKDVAVSATCLDENYNIVEVSSEEMKLGYRTSAFQQNNMIILSVKVRLKKGDITEIEEKMNEILKKRTDKQPLDYPSAGSTFKRPEGYYAGTLIEQNGLKGVTVGGAQVSEKHAGFVINKGNATASDVLSLIEKIKQTVKKSSGVELTPEVLFIGRRK